MKAEIHPEYKETVIQCTCGAIYQTRSTVQDLRIGICGACHPFFTGEQRFVDTAGRVDKFAQRYGSSQAKRAEKPRRDVEQQKPRKKKEDENAPEPEWENPAAEEAVPADDAAVGTPEAEAAPAAAAAEEKTDAAPAPEEAPAAEATPEADADAADSAES